jgi:thiol-disulfide isomerase/thioredoxin
MPASAGLHLSMPRRIWSWSAAAALALAALVGALLFQRQGGAVNDADAAIPERLPPSPAPELTVQRADGSWLKLSELRGRPVVLHFWATWCPPCREELPALLEFGGELEREGAAQLVALSTESEWELVRRYFGGKVPDAVAIDKAGDANDIYRLALIPETFVISAQGQLRLRFEGPADWREASVREAVRRELRP